MHFCFTSSGSEDNNKSTKKKLKKEAKKKAKLEAKLEAKRQAKLEAKRQAKIEEKRRAKQLEAAKAAAVMEEDRGYNFFCLPVVVMEGRLVLLGMLRHSHVIWQDMPNIRIDPSLSLDEDG